jgi:hypothetical protein
MRRTARTDSAQQQRKRRSRPTPRWLSKKTDLDVVARNRVMMVLAVLSGEKPVTSAVEEAGISRGFYYQLETKAINAMLLALAPGGDGHPSPDATGLTQRIRDLEDKLAKAEQEKRRSDRLLFVTRKLAGPTTIKTNRGRPRKAADSTKAGPKPSRFSATTKQTKPAPSTPTHAVSSIPTPDGSNAAR